ncbi:MAG: CoA transferase [Betaproteobacteria bacterium]|nr:CoA transferase [Betaproteobacteria bacterium]
MNPALSGVRVVDLTQFESGTSCTETLAWLGADVVKIEEPTRGEKGRFASTEKPGLDSYYFIVLNANKRSVACDLKSAHGKEILRKLIAKADVMVENLAPGAIERLGFSYDVVKQINPKIIYAQIKGFAPDGPRANYLSFDVVSQSVGGSLSTTGLAGGLPLRPGPTVADSGAGMHCVIGIQAALYQRQSTGRGQRIEVAMQEAVINFNRIAYAAYLLKGKPPKRNGNSGVLGTSAPGDVYRCKPSGDNDYVFIYTSRGGNKHWQKLLKLIGREDLANDRRFSSPEARIENVAEVDSLLSEWCSTRTKIEAMDTLQNAGVPAGAVLDVQEISEDPHLRKRGMFVTVDHPVRGPLTMPAWPVKMSESHVPVKCSPLLGEHTEEVLSEWLGLGNKDIQEVR